MTYFIKGFGKVRVQYHRPFRAFEYEVNGVSFLSMGPGWAYSFNYLKGSLLSTYNYLYTPKVDDCIVDIGAGLGEETVIYAMLVGEKGAVYSFEANPVTFHGLQYLCQRNGFTWVRPQHLAIYKDDGEVMIEDDEENYLVNTISATGSSNAKTPVKARTLDSIVKEHNIARIDFLKSNIEGAEQYLIEGMGDAVRLIRNICISCHDFRHVYHNHGEFYVTKEKVKSFLKENGFEIVERNTENRVINDYVYGRNIH